MKRVALVLISIALLGAAMAACSTDASDAPTTTTSRGTGGQAPDTAVEQRCTVIFQTPTSGQTSARRTVIRIETGEEVAVYEAGERMPPLDEVPGCKPQ